MGWLFTFVLLAFAVWAFGSLTSSGRSRNDRRSSRRERGSSEDWDHERETWEGSFWEAKAQVPCNARVHLSYVDANANATQRHVTVRRFDPSSPTGLILGHCHLRNETRTFRMDRIKRAVDSDTGEVVHDLRAHLEARKDLSLMAFESLLVEHADVMRVLLYVGKADGQLRLAEKEVIAGFARDLTGDAAIDTASIDAVLADVGVPTLGAYKLAVGRITDIDKRNKVLAAVKNIIATQKVVSPSEQEALAYMERRFASVPRAA